MEDILVNILYLLVFLITLKLLFFRKRFKNPPPSPPSLPIIGNLYQVKQPIHRTLHELSRKYGPIFTLQFGSQPVLVVSSASAAEECFTKNDIVLANRFLSSKTKYLGFNHTIITAASYGDHWRNLRRISSLEILSTHRLNSFLGIRKDETAKLLRKLAKGSDKDFTRVELKPMFAELTFNIIMRMVCGKRYYGEEHDGTDPEEARKFREIVNEISQFGLGSNLGDFVPVFRWFDFSGPRKLRKVGEKLDSFFQGLIDEHRNKKESSNTMIGHLLSSQESQPEYYTDQIIKGLIMALYVAGTETSAVTLEWAMSNLLNHPEILEKARVELDTKVGRERLVEEADVSKLEYLQNIISETLRLHPPLPMLLPHFSSQDCTVGGYDVPRNTMLFVNAWAIHRDPELWTDPTSFKPERFQSGAVEAHKLIPFGLGRRACPGAGLAQRTVGWTLASLIQCFEWKRIGEEEVDLTDGRGTVVPKLIPLEAQCRARPIICPHNLMSIILLFLLFLMTLNLLRLRKRHKNPPPSPPSLPIIGNLHQLKQPLHRTLHALSNKYGPVFSLRFGSQAVVVVSSASAAEECFTKNDIILANRFQSIKSKYLGFNHTILLAASYGDHWRNLRRISSLEILSTHRLNSFLEIRKDETQKLLRKLARASKEDFARLEFRSLFADLTFNTIMRMVCGKRYYGEEFDGTNAEEANKFRDIMNEMSQFGLGSHLGDFVPLFRLFDFSGSHNKLRKTGEKMDALFQGLVDEHRNKNENSNTMINHLLSLQDSQPEYYTDEIIKGLIMVLIVAGTETSAIALEWAMSNLLNHPQVLEKARVELDALVGQERLIEEAEVTKLEYLQNIISETLRLHPPAPMLLPHFSSEDCTVGGYDVPRSTMLFVNAWTIHRDPELWTDPTSFKPERFQNGTVEAQKLIIPFGLGRRACPGASLAQRTVGWTLASLIQCFEWKRIGQEEVDMTEGWGTLVPKLIPLEAQCKTRPIISNIF
ncbi:Cytochrome P450 81E8, partial [Mucuna pruriens]